MRKPVKRLLLILGLAITLLSVACGVWVSDYYRAAPEAATLLSGSEAVAVTAVEGGWLLDGPGTQDALIFYPGGKVEAAAYLPLLMALAAGAMMFVVTADMIPDAARERSGILLVMAGYVIMMAMDVALG